MKAFRSVPKGFAGPAGARLTPGLTGKGWRTILGPSETSNLGPLRALSALLLLTALFAALLLGVYILHIRYIPVDVIFYAALGDALIAAAATAAVALATRHRFGLSLLEVTLLAIIWLLAGYSFAISGPALLDRSLSFYILEKLEQRGGGIRQNAIGQVFVSEYMPEFRLVDVRLTEQLESGTIVIENGCVRLTERGHRLARFSRFVRTHLLARHRLLAGQYTDALVHPYAASAKGPIGYECP
ncbi:MAG TPA: hypothetical protein VFZ16_00750 [Hyphomicrobiaceae bacterium]|nr:hypothetical protein [Hyphomicrobiaceae bacterium]